MKWVRSKSSMRILPGNITFYMEIFNDFVSIYLLPETTSIKYIYLYIYSLKWQGVRPRNSRHVPVSTLRVFFYLLDQHTCTPLNPVLVTYSIFQTFTLNISPGHCSDSTMLFTSYALIGNMTFRKLIVQISDDHSPQKNIIIHHL